MLQTCIFEGRESTCNRVDLLVEVCNYGLQDGGTVSSSWHCGAREASAFGVGELPSTVSVTIGITGVSVYSSKGEGEGARDSTGDGLQDSHCFSLHSLVEISKGWGCLCLSVSQPSC